MYIFKQLQITIAKDQKNTTIERTMRDEGRSQISYVSWCPIL